jgi:hypothetical protein
MIAVPLLVALVASADALPTSPAQGPLSWEQANSLTRKLEDIERRRAQPKKRPQSVLFTQGEVNSYLNLAYAERLPKGVKDVLVRLDRDRMQVKGLVDIDRVKGKVESGGGLLSFLSGDVPVEATGKVSGKDGFGQVTWESVYVGGVRLPISALEQMVRSSTRTEEQPDGFDIHAPFRLPYSVEKLRVEPGRALLEF